MMAILGARDFGASVPWPQWYYLGQYSSRKPPYRHLCLREHVFLRQWAGKELIMENPILIATIVSGDYAVMRRS
jgi:hypothetical protein